jgi:hypothetical protein
MALAGYRFPTDQNLPIGRDESSLHPSPLYPPYDLRPRHHGTKQFFLALNCAILRGE